MARIDITCAYSRVPAKPSQAFPSKTEVLMPLFQMVVGTPSSGSIGFTGLLDTGAVHTMFKTDIAEALGLDWRNAPTVPIRGIAGGVSGHAMDVTLAITEHKYSWVSRVVFCPPPFEIKLPLIGHMGFFEHFEVRFRSDKNFHVFLK